MFFLIFIKVFNRDGHEWGRWIMAYMSQEKKAELAPGIKAVLKKYNMKASISVRHHTGLVVTIKSGPLFRDQHNAYKEVNEFDFLY